MAQLAIKGHATRGREVIKLLEMLGGENKRICDAFCESLYFYIDEKTKSIYYDWITNSEDDDVCLFTLEDFLENYPYKIGDRVCFSDDSNHYLTIERMWWNESSNDVECTFLEDAIDVSMKDLQPYKEEIMEEGEMLLGWVVESKGKRLIPPQDYEIMHDGEEFYLVKKKTQYPKNFEECCGILDVEPYSRSAGYKSDLITAFRNLLICRDAYWKIAGEKMGLCEPWKPDWLNKEQDKFVLYTEDGDICLDCFLSGNNVLAFPTKEMRDVFYKNFKDLIELNRDFL